MGQKPLVSLRPSEQKKKKDHCVKCRQKMVEDGDWSSVFGFSDVECLFLKYYQPRVLTDKATFIAYWVKECTIWVN